MSLYVKTIMEACGCDEATAKLVRDDIYAVGNFVALDHLTRAQLKKAARACFNARGGAEGYQQALVEHAEQKVYGRPEAH